MRRLAALGLVFAAACASDPPAPFAYLELRAGADAPAGLRAVAVWRDDGAVGRGVATTDDHPVDGAPFGLALVPPEPDVDFPLASAGLVAYLDTDGDGRFSFTSPTDRGFRDRVVGWVPGVRVRFDPREGVTLERSVIDNGALVTEPLPGDTPLELHIFDLEQTACFGMAPAPVSMPIAVSDAVDLLDPVPALPWPYPVAMPWCPDGALPADWLRIDCTETAGVYRVTTAVWPEDPAIADLCGWSAWYCAIGFADGVEPPLEFPACDP